MFLSTQDAVLLERKFTTESPEELPQMLELLPDDWREGEIELDYDLRGLKRPDALCAHPGRHRHRIGFVLRMRDGRRFMVGQHCGAKHHGADLKRMKKVFDAEKDRHLNLTIATRAYPLLPGAMSDLRSALTDATINQFSLDHRALRRALGSSFSNLVDAVQRRNGVLSITERVRDYAAEERRQPRVDEAMSAVVREAGRSKKRLREGRQRVARENASIWTEVSRDVGILSGRPFVCPAAMPSEDFVAALEAARAAFRALAADTSKLDNRALRQAVVHLRTVVLLGRRAQDTFAARAAFFAASNLARISVVCGARVDGHFLVGASGETFKIPERAEALDLAGLDALEAALAARKPAVMADE